MKVLIVALAGAAVLAASPAWACGIMERAEPRVGHTVKGSLDHVSLFFSEAVMPTSSTIQVLDASGHNHAQFVPTNLPTTVLVTRVGHMVPGTYKVVWQAYWQDCASTTPGDFQFTVAK